MIQELFPEKQNRPLPLKDADIYFFPNFLEEDLADAFFKSLQENTPWRQDEIKIFGKAVPQPRLTAFFADNNKSYTYSGITMRPRPFPQDVLEIKDKAEKTTATNFTTCLLNYYRDGKDSMGWHADDEKALGENPTIASVSLGASRMFHLKHRKDPELRYKLQLPHGSLLLMKGPTQHFWQHQVPKTSKQVTPRINLTFRRI